MAVRIGSARMDENGRATGGKAGDQTGVEVSTQNWYKHSKGWVLLRAKDQAKALLIAKAMRAACDNNKIGYDQNQNQTLWNEAKKVGYDPAKVTTACETDCARLVRLCCAYAGIIASDFYTATEVSALMATGAFDKGTSDKYTKQSSYLREGDILVTKTKGHTVVVLSDGPLAYKDAPVDDSAMGSSLVNPYPVPTRVLKNGAKGQDVKWAQFELNQDGEKLIIDGEFGPNTLAAIERVQKVHKLPINGEIDSETIAVLIRCDGTHVNAPVPIPETGHVPPASKPGLIIDVSHHNSADWDKAVANHNISMVIIRVQDNTTLDRNLKTNIKGVTKHGIPYGVYAFIRAKSESAAKTEAKMFVDRALSAANGYNKPRFWMVDAEVGNSAAATKAFGKYVRDYLITLGWTNPVVGLYASDSDMIGRYKSIVPSFHRIWTADWRTACKKWSDIWCKDTDLWQYGYVTVAGLGNKVDGNRLPDGMTVDKFINGA